MPIEFIVLVQAHKCSALTKEEDALIHIINID